MTAVLAATRAILVVEDNAADADLVADALSAASFPPVLRVAATGPAALELLRDETVVPPPDLVLLDLNLPGLSGLSTLESIKSDPRLRRIPVIVLTTSKSQHEIDRCYDRGAAAVLNKPLRLHDYREMLGALERFWLAHVRFAEGRRGGRHVR